ncbi:hypothetical protein SAMN05444411_102262 [Lutibacter oricola]|uniref:Uncharacterized protein n=1 Tax=Lutibacter oricola TaxID=762486 RepID=A0A1H2WQT1_9FLAO|nr:hypothetical protein [Lutibacter oricola]SDW82951.1 hypothetical protein SAMN05444411_102262 [Lutibacter oricola]
MKNTLIIISLLFLLKTYGQNEMFYEDIGNSLMFYSQINKDPVIISHGQILNEQTLPNYSKGLQFMQAPGLFSSVNELYNYLTNNNDFFFQNFSEPASYYNKNNSHSAQRNQYYTDGVTVYNKSLSISNDNDARDDTLYELISDVRYQVVFQETYIKDNNYEFLILSTLNVLQSDINLNIQSEIDSVSNIFLKLSTPSEIEEFGKNLELYCLIKENDIWKACSIEAHLKYLEDNGYMEIVTNKINSNNFYDVLSTVNNGIRVYTEN